MHKNDKWDLCDCYENRIRELKEIKKQIIYKKGEKQAEVSFHIWYSMTW